MVRLLLLFVLAVVVAVLVIKYVLPDLIYWRERLLRRWGYIREPKVLVVEPAARAPLDQLESLRASGRITAGQLQRLTSLPSDQQAEQVQIVLYANELWYSLGFLTPERRQTAIAQFAQIARDGSLPDPARVHPPLTNLVRGALRQEHTPETLRATVEDLVRLAAELGDEAVT